MNPRLDGRQRSSDPVYPIKQGRCLAFYPRCHLLDRVRPSNGIDSVRGSALMKDDLLGAQRDGRAFFGWERQSFILAIAVQRLRAAEHG
jgi:hypothetical protein